MTLFCKKTMLTSVTIAAMAISSAANASPSSTMVKYTQTGSSTLFTTPQGQPTIVTSNMATTPNIVPIQTTSVLANTPKKHSSGCEGRVESGERPPGSCGPKPPVACPTGPVLGAPTATRDGYAASALGSVMSGYLPTGTPKVSGSLCHTITKSKDCTGSKPNDGKACNPPAGDEPTEKETAACKKKMIAACKASNEFCEKDEDACVDAGLDCKTWSNVDYPDLKPIDCNTMKEVETR